MPSSTMVLFGGHACLGLTAITTLHALNNYITTQHQHLEEIDICSFFFMNGSYKDRLG